MKKYKKNPCRVFEFQKQNSLWHRLWLKSIKFVKYKVSIIRLTNISNTYKESIEN